MKLEGLKFYENIDMGNCRINPDALDKINGHPKNAIVIDEEYESFNLLGLYPEELDLCIIIKKEL